MSPLRQERAAGRNCRAHRECKTVSTRRVCPIYEGLHHVTLVMNDIDKTRRFYGQVLGLNEIPLPQFLRDRPLVWYEVGHSQIHIAHVSMNPMLFPPREGERNHIAIRVKSFRAVQERLEIHRWPYTVQPDSRVGFPQIMLRDPAGNLIEINAERLD